MRISDVQRDTLRVLLFLENAGGRRPVGAMRLRDTVNGLREFEVAASNFRISCHTMNENGLIDKYRNRQLQLAFCLTDKGKEVAQRFEPLEITE